MGIPWTPVWQGVGIIWPVIRGGDTDLLAIAVSASRSGFAVWQVGDAGLDTGLAGAPDLYLEFRQGLRVAGEGGVFVERDLDFRVGQLLQHAEHIELGFVHRMFDFLDVDAPELLAPMIEALLRCIRRAAPQASAIPGFATARTSKKQRLYSCTRGFGGTEERHRAPGTHVAAPCPHLWIRYCSDVATQVVPSSTALTFLVSESGVYGFCRKATSFRKMPCRTTVSSVLPLVYNTFIFGNADRKDSANCRPPMPGITTSVISRSMGPRNSSATSIASLPSAAVRT